MAPLPVAIARGWAIGDESAGDDERDAAALYTVLEREVLPAWRDRDRWTRMRQASIEMGVSKFSSDRMVREYFQLLYADGAASPAVATPSTPAAASAKAASAKQAPHAAGSAGA